MYIHKNNLVLRKIERNDLPILLALKNESWFGTHKVSILNSSDQEKWFDRISGSHTDLVLIAEERLSTRPDKRVGTFKIANIDWLSRSCDVGHDIFSHSRGTGFGYKIVEAGIDFCFEILNMNRLAAEVLENNVASQKTLFGGGFLKEGNRSKAVYKCNQYLDSIICGIIRDNWQNLKRVKDYGGLCNQSYTPLNGK